MRQTCIPEFVRAIEAATSTEQAFDALRDLSMTVIGAKLFTVLTNDSTNGTSCRLYSNMPDAYPVSGTKPANRTDWSRHVLEEQRIFVANRIEDIALVFKDHELIHSLGCESVINIPIIVAGDVLGTINCLHERDYYTAERVQAANDLKLPGAVCLLFERLHQRSTMQAT